MKIHFRNLEVEGRGALTVLGGFILCIRLALLCNLIINCDILSIQRQGHMAYSSIVTLNKAVVNVVDFKILFSVARYRQVSKGTNFL